MGDEKVGQIPDNVKYGLAYVEDIYRFLELYGKFDIGMCVNCRRDYCKRLPNREMFEERFVESFGDNVISRYNTNPRKLFRVLVSAFDTAVYKSHATAYLLAACDNRRNDEVIILKNI